MTIVPGDFELTMDELRAVTRFAAASAQDLQRHWLAAHADDPRPAAALRAAWDFAEGGRRTMGQRQAATDAHRSALQATGEIPRLAARAAGDAAAAAYLHPIARTTQIGHILRAAACGIRIAELTTSADPDPRRAAMIQAHRRASPVVIDVLCRYPPSPPGHTALDRILGELDLTLRGSRVPY